MKKSDRIAVIGAGKMATAIAGGLVRSGTFDKAELMAYDISPQAAAKFTESTGVKCLSGELEETPLQEAGAVLLAVKPQYLADALNGWKYILETKLIISIAAGISLERLYDLTDSARIVRVMPNTPALVGAGAAVGAMTAEVTQEERSLTEKIFQAIGTFSVMRPSAVAGRTVLVVDDIMTTGATLSECAAELRRAGARRVWCVTLARSLRSV